MMLNRYLTLVKDLLKIIAHSNEINNHMIYLSSQQMYLLKIKFYGK